MFHPIEGFEELRWKKEESVSVSTIVVLMFFISTVIQVRTTGFIFDITNERHFNIIPLFSGTILLFILWVVSNWSICTLMDGEGKFKNIFVVSSYALVPYIITTLLGTFFSHILIHEEGVFRAYIQWIGTGWSIILVITALMSVHQYTMKKAIISAILTISGIVIMIFLLVLVLGLFQQMAVFMITIYSEIIYRISV